MPTWNYTTVHAWGRPCLIEDGEWLWHQLHELTQQQEQVRSAPWKVSDAPPLFITAQLKGIVGLELDIDQLEGKWKFSQNRPEGDRKGVLAGFREQGKEARAMAELVAEYGSLEDS